MKVIFSIKREGNQIIYPDDISLFGNTEVKGDNIIADYSGDLALAKYIPDPEPVMISNVEIWDRFTEGEQENLIDSTNKKINKFLYELRIRPSFDLKNQKLINAIKVLETDNIIGAGRANKILT